MSRFNKDRQVVARSTQQIGSALLNFRKRALLSQTVVAERAGLEQKIVSSVERGALGTRLNTLCKILAALDLELVVRTRTKE